MVKPITPSAKPNLLAALVLLLKRPVTCFLNLIELELILAKLEYIYINAVLVERVTNCKYLDLGLYIDDRLQWTRHIDHVRLKLLRYNGILYNLREILPPTCVMSIYFAIVYARMPWHRTVCKYVQNIICNHYSFCDESIAQD